LTVNDWRNNGKRNNATATEQVRVASGTDSSSLVHYALTFSCGIKSQATARTLNAAEVSPGVLN